MPIYYPVFLNLENRLCVVVGGGEVAERKIEALLDCGASVTVVSPQVIPAVAELAAQGKVRWVQRRYQEGDLEGAFLAIACTDDIGVNRDVAREGQRHNVLLNVVDEPSLCTFTAPAIARRGQVTIAISTGGASPALARRLREELERNPALDWADAAPLLSEVRLELRARGVQVPPDRWQECMTDDVLALVKDGRWQEAREKLLCALLQGTVAREV